VALWQRLRALALLARPLRGAAGRRVGSQAGHGLSLAGSARTNVCSRIRRAGRSRCGVPVCVTVLIRHPEPSRSDSSHALGESRRELWVSEGWRSRSRGRRVWIDREVRGARTGALATLDGAWWQFTQPLRVRGLPARDRLRLAARAARSADRLFVGVPRSESLDHFAQAATGGGTARTRRRSPRCALQATGSFPPVVGALHGDAGNRRRGRADVADLMET